MSRWLEEFRRARAAPLEVRRMTPRQVGWLRRRELDGSGLEVWERPDGALHAHDPRDGVLVVEVLA